MTTLPLPNHLDDLEQYLGRHLPGVDVARVEQWSGHDWRRMGEIPPSEGRPFMVTIQRDVGSVFEACSTCNGEQPSGCSGCLGEGGITVHKVIEGSGEGSDVETATDKALMELSAAAEALDHTTFATTDAAGPTDIDT